MATKNKKGLRKFQTIILILSFLLVSVGGYLYLINYTNFISQGLSLIEGINQSINPWIMWAFSLGLILFGVFLFTSKRFGEILWIFFIDGLQLVSGALLVLGLFVPYVIQFRLGLIISAFIIYFVSHIARENVPKIIKLLENKKK